ncbi:hypothetical protein AQUCO_07600117v1 [Aquilegia coerulea]|uniref:Sm domain-containing protein n=1 Tax=Aquilegia coerulea TaxID=218851 RepID=A0A2G5C8Z6_AQUCA|nr:hypothetical protein AQUCO_07600117v1 [Aquilegia coerulea]
MSIQQVVQSRPSSNGFGRKKVERDSGTRMDNKLLSGKSNSGSFSNAGSLNGKVGAFESPSRDRLIYMTTCLMGHPVEVQVKNGSVISGLFHATNADKEFGIILKMARVIKDGPFKGQKLATDSVGKGLLKTMIIPAKELVQVIAKDVAVTGNELITSVQHEKRQDIMIDSYISQGFVEAERELGRWAPDEDDPQCPELENIFDGPWNRHWDQFETNAALFGVKSTFDEELYTTKLERGPQMREREREALRIAKEIEGEDTQDLHMKEERGFDFNEDFDIDEETRFSSVFRGISDNGYEENEEIVLDSHNTDTFGGPSESVISRSFSDVARRKNEDGTHASSSFSSLDEAQLPQPTAGRDMYRSASGDYARQLDAESRMNENQFREQQSRKNGVKELTERKTLIDVSEEGKTSKFVDIKSSLNTKKSSSDKGGLSSSATAYAPSSSISSKDQAQTDSLGESSDGAGSKKVHAAAKPGNHRGRPGSSASSTSERAAPASASSAPGLSPSSSMGSLSSEKSTLNPYAKEFKLNPNAKSFTPTQTPLRPSSPIPDGSYYFPANVSTVPHMHGVPVGIGATPVQGPQAYIHPNGPLYGQQMILGHPRQVLYMPNYPPDMPYKGRDF